MVGEAQQGREDNDQYEGACKSATVAVIFHIIK